MFVINVLHCICTSYNIQPYIESLESCCVEVVLVCSTCPILFRSACFSYILGFTFLLLGKPPKVQAISEPEPQPNDSCTNHCSTGRVIVCVLVVVGLCLVGGSVYWIYSSSAPGPSTLNQGEGKVAVLCEMVGGRLC